MQMMKNYIFPKKNKGTQEKLDKISFAMTELDIRMDTIYLI